MIERTDRDEFCIVMRDALPHHGIGATADLVRRLIRAGRTSARLSEARRNRELTEREERRLESLRSKLAAELELYGIGLVYQSDPRGATLSLCLQSGATNDWRRTGWCVPGS